MNQKVDSLRREIGELEEHINRENNLDELIAKYTSIEEKFMAYLNNNQPRDAGRIVSAVDEHLWRIAMDKLREQGKEWLAETLFYEIDKNFSIKDSSYGRSYIYEKTGEEVMVTLKDVFEYGNESVWEDF